MKLSSLLLLVLLPLTATAAEIEGTTFPETSSVDGKALVLNGVGIRTATLFKVGVYVAALYLPTKTTDPVKVTQSTWPREIRMAFLRDISAEDMAKAWDQSFSENCQRACDKQHSQLTILKSYMQDVKKGDRMRYVFVSPKVTVEINERLKGTITDADFTHNLLLTWLGEHPPTEKLKAGLMGSSR